MLAAVHLSLLLTAPIGTAAVAFLVWCWVRQGRNQSPRSRVQIRRIATVLMIMTVPLLVLGVSVHDPAVNQRGYILTWTATMGMILLIVFFAIADVINNMRLHHHRLSRQIADSLQDLSGRNGSDPGDEAPTTENGI